MIEGRPGNAKYIRTRSQYLVSDGRWRDCLRKGIKHIVGGMCETDFSGYPDCRDDTLKALQATLNLGMESRLVIDTPLMWLDKAATWSLAHH